MVSRKIWQPCLDLSSGRRFTGKLLFGNLGSNLLNLSDGLWTVGQNPGAAALLSPRSYTPWDQCYEFFLNPRKLSILTQLLALHAEICRDHNVGIQDN
jgi:hypothetical protein